MIGSRRNIVARGGNPYALEFDGTNDYVDIPAGSIPSGNEITFALWNYGITAKTSSVIEARAGDASGAHQRTLNVHLPWSNGEIYFDSGDGSFYDRINKEVTDGEYKGWNHWAFTKNAATGEMKIYRNGVLWHSGSGKTKTIAETTSVAIGSYQDGTNNFHRGIIDDVRIYERALHPNEIKLQSKGVPISKKGLVGHWNFNEGQGDIAHDISGNGNNGTLAGNPTWTTDTPL